MPNWPKLFIPKDQALPKESAIRQYPSPHETFLMHYLSMIKDGFYTLKY